MLLRRFPLLRESVLCVSLVTSFQGAGTACYGLTATPYSSEVNDRFAGGYPGNPVENTSPNFVGFGLNWSAVGWATSNATKGFGFLSPQHYLVARHYGGDAQIRVWADGELVTGLQSTVTNTGFGLVFINETLGDLSLGTLTAPLHTASALPRYAVLDLNNSSSSDSPANYNNLPVLLYGRGLDPSSSPRIGSTTINSVTVSGNNSFFTTLRTTVQLEVGDSGSPAFHAWTNPNGGQELTILGNHSSINATLNFINFLGTHQVMDALNTQMNPHGFALRVVGNPSSTWQGAFSTHINSPFAWSSLLTTNDTFVRFHGSNAASRNVNVNANHNLRGLYFLSTNSTSNGFTFSGSNTLTVGRGGITNYDSSRQTFSAPLALGRPQYWNGGSGGITIGSLNTNGHLLEITGSGENRITGVVSGSGSLAVSGGVLELSGANLYSNRTWVHAGGELRTANTSGSATGTSEVEVAAGGTLSGTGNISGPVTIHGTHSPGSPVGWQSFSANLTYQPGALILWQLTINSADPLQRGVGYDGIYVGGILDFAGFTSLELDFAVPGSVVSWWDPFWDDDRLGDEGWLILENIQVPLGWNNLALANASFLDSNGVDLWSLRPLSQFSLTAVQNNIFLTYTAGQVIPEPRSIFLLLLGFGGLAFRRWMVVRAG